MEEGTLLSPTINEAIALAAMNHKDQTDKVGQPYIYHPLRVMLKLTSEEEKIVGVLHDVVEDTPLTLDDLRVLGYSREIVEAIDSVTKRPHEKNDYAAFIERVRIGSTIAIKVKLADLADNTDPTRRTEDNALTTERMEKYQKAIAVLEEELAKRG